MADPGGATHHRHDAPPMIDGSHFGGIGDTGQHPDRPRHSHQHHQHDQESQRRSDADPHRDHRQKAGTDDHRLPLPDPGDQHSRRDVEQQIADAAQAHEQPCHRDRQSHIEGQQREDRNRGTLADRKEEGGEIDGQGQRADAEPGSRQDTSCSMHGRPSDPKPNAMSGGIRRT